MFHRIITAEVDSSKTVKKRIIRNSAMALITKTLKENEGKPIFDPGTKLNG